MIINSSNKIEKMDEDLISLESFTFLCFTAIFFVIDMVTPLEINIGVLYSLPVWASLFLGRSHQLLKLTAVLALFFIILGAFVSLGEITLSIFLNRLFSCALILITYYLCQIFKRGLIQKMQFEDRFFAALESTPAGVILIDMSGKIVVSNSALNVLFEYTEIELSLLSFEALIPNEVKQKYSYLVSKFLANPKGNIISDELEIFGKAKSGKLIPIDVALNLIESNGESFVIATVTDITNRKENFRLMREKNKKLEQSESEKAELIKELKSLNIKNKETISLLEAIREHAAHALISTDLNGLITSFNSSAEKMLGYKASELIGKENPGKFHDVQEVINRSAEFSEKLEEEIEPGFKTFVCHTNLGLENEFEWIYVNKTGVKFPVLLTVSSLFDEEGRLSGYLGIAQDITKTKEVARKLEQSNEELAQFAYRTSHDLKAPLATMKGLIGFVKEDLESGDIDEVNLNLREIENQVEKLTKLVVGILNLAKGDLQECSYELVNTYYLLNKLKESLDLELKQKDVSFTFKTDRELFVYTQELRIEQILYNLVLNSIKYSDSNKEIKFVEICFEISEVVKIKVCDNGLGIPLKFQDKLFEMFTRFHPNQAEGSGLGMSIVKKNIEALGGEISFLSSEKGSEFEILLPIKEKL